MKLLKISFLFLFSGCLQSERSTVGESPTYYPEAPVQTISLTAEDDESHDKQSFTLGDFYSDNPLLQKQVDIIYNNLSLVERAAQLIMPATSEYYKIGIPFSEIKTAVLNKQIGGVLYLKGTKKKFAEEIQELNAFSKTSGGLPLISSCDCEPTLYHKKFRDADSVTATNLLTSDVLVEKSVERISSEIFAMGIRLNFAPVVDIAQNKEVIKTRSFSKNPDVIVSRSNKFVEVSQQMNIAATLKHFPGHGAVKGDSHKRLVYIDKVLTEIETFRKIINQSHPIAVMVGHIAINNNSDYDENIPASISRKVITRLLKEELGFKGIVVTDAMQMKAVLNIQNASWKAIIAGADLIIMPVDIKVLHNQIVNELKKTSSLQNQLTISIKKILRLKVCAGVVN